MHNTKCDDALMNSSQEKKYFHDLVQLKGRLHNRKIRVIIPVIIIIITIFFLVTIIIHCVIVYGFLKELQ